MNVVKKDNPARVNLLLLLASCLCFSFFLLQLSGFYHDDAYIGLRYAKNILAGNGLVWNIGEKVEGYTCFLWVALISVLGYFHVDLVIASRLLGIFFALLTLIVFFIFEKQKIAFGALLLSANSCFALWALGGLETVAFGFFILLGYYLFLMKDETESRLLPAGLAFGLAAMTRPEGVLFFAVTVLFCLFEHKRFTRTNFIHALLFSAGFLSLYLPYFIWRLYYYGHLFPCTFYVKGGVDLFKLLFGSRYIFDFFVIYGFPLLCLPFVKKWKAFLAATGYSMTLLLSYLVYILIIGGDHMQGFRFFVPVLPLLYVFVQEIFYNARFGRNSTQLAAVAILVIGLNFFVSYNTIPQSPESNIEAMSHTYRYRMCFKVQDPAAYMGKFVGLYIKKHWPANATVASNTAGSIPYFSDMNFIDMLGLNDYTIAQRNMSYEYGSFLKEIMDIKKLLTFQGRSEIIRNITKGYLPYQLVPGHGKGDGRYVLSRKPDYIIIGSSDGAEVPSFLGDREILNSTDFQKNYHLKKIPIRIYDQFYTFYWATKTGILNFRYYERNKEGE
jgi:hypothetical protein